MLTAKCSDDPVVSRVWNVHNPNTFAVPFAWQVYGAPVSGNNPLNWTSFIRQSGSGTASANADTVFSSPTVAGPNPAAIFWTQAGAPLGFGFSVSLSSTAVCSNPVRINPQPGGNVNMVSGTGWPGGDPFLQRQNEPSIAFSTRNPLHLVAGANDYRSVDLPFPDVNTSDEEYAGDAWLGLFKSFDGGQTWQSTLLPGYPQDVSPEGLSFKGSVGAFRAAADPIVRAGTSGLLLYAGIAFNRPAPGVPNPDQGALFVSRFIDLNNKENGDVTQALDPIRYLGAAPVAFSSGSGFVDKPAMAVDIPRGGATCTFSVPQGTGSVPQTVPAGNVYLAYSAITGSGLSLQATVFFTRSSDCGSSWSAPVALSSPSQNVSQGSAVAVDPASGDVFVAWRQFASGVQPNALNVVRVTGGGTTPGPVVPVATRPSFDPLNPTATTFFDQGTTPGSVRTNAYPSIAVDGSGRVYLAWAERQPLALGDARIVLSTSPDGASWSAPTAIDGSPATDDTGHLFSRGHQFMPQITFNGGRLTAIYYDLRFDHTLGLFTPVANFPTPDSQGRFELETRALCGAAGAPCPSEPSSLVFTPFLDDSQLTVRRHTLDMRLAQAGPGASPVFTTRRLSQYKFGTRGDETGTDTVAYLQQLQLNPPNFPMFQLGTVPFLGDYIDVAGVPFVQSPPGGPWVFNTAPSKAGTQFAVWTSNQDVVPPYDPLSGTVNWTLYTPPRSALNAGNGGNSSIFDSGQTVPACESPFTGSRNQNIYGALITQDFLFSSPQNSKPLSATLQRAFVVVAQNLTNFDKTFRLVIENQPPGGWASFTAGTNQPLAAPAPVVTTIDLAVAAHSTAARSVFATSSAATAAITVSIAETASIGGPLVVNGLTGFVALNGDASTPGLVPPDGVPDAASIGTVEVYMPNVTNPNVTNPNVTNPNVTNPNVTNPNVTNSDVVNPNVTNPNVTNPNVTNPNVTNPNVTNPDIANPNVTNPNVTNPNVTNPNVTNVAPSDAVYTVTNTGNTAAAYRVALVGTVPAGVTTQLIITKTYKTLAGQNCELFEQDQELLLANVLNPVFSPPTGNLNDPNVLDPGISNPTIALKPNESATVTIRAYIPPTTLGTIVAQAGPVVIPQGANTNSPTNAPTSAIPGGATLSPGVATILTGSLPDSVVLTPGYSATPIATGLTGPATWSVSVGTLPSGLAINPASGQITGTPLAVGTSSFTLQVTDGAHTATRDYVVRIGNSLSLGAAVLPTGTVGTPYSASVSATGGLAPLAYSLLSGALPAGLSLSSGGAITGAPLLAGTSNFTLRVTDSLNPTQAATQAFSITISPINLNVSFTGQPPASAVGGQAFGGVTVHVQDGVASPIPGASVTITLGSSPCPGATVAGTISNLTDPAGNASFPSLTIDRGGPGFALQANVPSSTPATSAPFFVEGFCATGGLSSPRKWHTATPLSNGKVLIAGGSNGTTALATAELYDPTTQTFSPTGSMGTARAFHSATALADGRVLVVGGGSDFETGTLGTAEIYDPLTGTFSGAASLVGHTRQMHGAALLNDGRVLIAGGFTNDSGIGGLDTAELYDPTTNAFTSAASPMVHNRVGDFTTTVLPDGRVLLTGGFQNLVGGPAIDAELFDPSTGTFGSTATTMSTFRGKHGANLLPDGRVLLTGGENDTGFLANADLFDPSTAAISAAAAALGVSRESHTAFPLASGRTLLAGGQTLVGATPTVLGTAERYDPASGSTPTGSLVVPRRLQTTTELADGTLLLVGGLDASGLPLSSGERFFPAPLLTVTTRSIPTGFQAQPYTATRLDAVGTSPDTWTAMAPLAAGFALDSTGVLAGKPTSAGTTSIWLKVTDALGHAQVVRYPVFVGSATATDGPVTISSVSVGGGGNEAVVLPGATVGVSFNYTIVDDLCPACVDQIQVGFADALPQVCAYSGIPGPTPGVSGSASISLTAPAAPGRYYIAFDRSQSFTCPTSVWWNGTPVPSHFIGAIDVVSPTPAFGLLAISNVTLNGGSDVLILPGGGSFTLDHDYLISNPVGCPSCIRQIEVGIATGLYQACTYDSIPPVSGVSGHGTTSLTVPATPGRYAVGFDDAFTFFCHQFPNWWNGPPGPSRELGLVIVP